MVEVLEKKRRKKIKGFLPEGYEKPKSDYVLEKSWFCGRLRKIFRR